MGTEGGLEVGWSDHSLLVMVPRLPGPPASQPGAPAGPPYPVQAAQVPLDTLRL